MSAHMPGQWCEPLLELCELLEPVEPVEPVELGAVWVVLGVVPVVVCVEPAALAIAAPPPAAAPVSATTVSSLVIRPRIGLHLLSVVRRLLARRSTPRVGESSQQAKNR
ncbi:MAG TPA: hypothetical protein VGI50_16190 [Solirubrobacteraceae bacterium]